MNAPQIHPGEICLFMATRGRPESLAQVFAALKACTVQKEKVSLWLYVDEDDTATRQAIDSGALNDAGVRIHWHIGPHTPSLCETQHTLWRNSGRTAEIFMGLADDIRFDTPGWDNMLREVAAKFPDGIFLASPHDPMTADTCTYPIFGWRWLETLQHIFPGHFPFWYDDRWVHQIGEMAGSLRPSCQSSCCPFAARAKPAGCATCHSGRVFSNDPGRTKGFRQKTH